MPKTETEPDVLRSHLTRGANGRGVCSSAVGQRLEAVTPSRRRQRFPNRP
ncbi:hypothetical protein RBH26_01750 [Natronolimnohabitans sp. A-GB9]|nr:hypothetical protein [Natronolimnohabitans sp. A-GB9]MDQ2049199.1 hypothetical protein [Natronolimnohabitans sp. A-GB9]